jgi:hypothetical protein
MLLEGSPWLNRATGARRSRLPEGNGSMQDDWTITAGTPDVVQQQGSTLVLEWPLNRTPDPEWEQFFVHSGAPRSGSLTFISHDPRVVGNKLRLFVEDRDIEAAARYVGQSIPLANQKFESQVMARRRRETAQKQEQEAAATARLEQARDRLRRVSNSGTAE